MTKVIERNTTIPARRTEMFSTAEDNQPAVDVVVLQGERERAADNRVLGRFRLENIRPAPRGEPQIEVTFDIDANGILNVSARDKDTGAEQRITISESSNLDQAEVERMVADAETQPGGGRRGCARRSTPATSSTRSPTRCERRLAELGDAAPAHEKARAEMLVADARQADRGRGAARPGALADRASCSRSFHGLLAARPARRRATGRRPGAATTGPTADDDDVIDAEFDRS